MKIVLVNLPWRSFGRGGVRAGSRWPHLKGPTEKDYLPFPFFLSYAAALLKKNKFDVTLIDAIAEGMSYRHFLKCLRDLKPDMVVCETSTVTLEHDLTLLEKMDKNTAIVLCGPDMNIRSPSFLRDHSLITYVIAGEYECTLLELVRNVHAGTGVEGIRGLIYRDAGEVRINPPRPLADLDDLPWPQRRELPMERYNDTPGDMPIPSAQILASRGCPYQCKFCLWPQVMYQSNRYRTRNVVDVVDEMEFLIHEMDFKSIYFDDDTFNCGKERMLKFCDEIKRRGLNVPWAIMARADLMDEEILVHMRDAGLFAVKYGVESASQELLDGINKNMDLKKTEAIITLTKRLGIKTHLTFTFGLPGETQETIRQTIECALRLDPTTIQFSLATPFPGTVFYKEMKETGRIVSENWVEYDGNYKSVIEYPDITKEDLERAITSAYKQWWIHCQKRNPVRKYGYDQVVINSVKKYGYYITVLKTIRFLIRTAGVVLSERLFYKKEIRKKIRDKGLQRDRMTLLFNTNGLGLYWEGMKLTRHKGFLSTIIPRGPAPARPAENEWIVEKRNDDEIMLIKKHRSAALDEIWRIKVIDEKQIDWDIDIDIKREIDILDKRVSLMLSDKYRTWIDVWGEGKFPPAHYRKEVEIRNPKSNFIGLRGRKKLKGQLPTILLDLSRNKNTYIPSIRNAASTLGARKLEVKMVRQNGNGTYAPGIYGLFSGRIKIVEEDFKKRTARQKR